MDQIDLHLQELNLRSCESPFSTSHIPTTLLDSSYCIDIQTSNTGKDRDRDGIRMNHDVKISIMKQHGLSPSKALIDIIKLETSIIKNIMTQSKYPSVRCSYQNTSRALGINEEYIISSLSFSIEESFSFTSI